MLNTKRIQLFNLHISLKNSFFTSALEVEIEAYKCMKSGKLFHTAPLVFETEG